MPFFIQTEESIQGRLSLGSDLLSGLPRLDRSCKYFWLFTWAASKNPSKCLLMHTRDKKVNIKAKRTCLIITGLWLIVRSPEAGQVCDRLAGVLYPEMLGHCRGRSPRPRSGAPATNTFYWRFEDMDRDSGRGYLNWFLYSFILNWRYLEPNTEQTKKIVIVGAMPQPQTHFYW